MDNLLDDEGFFKAKAPAAPQLFKRFCTECDVDFWSRNPKRKLCRFCAGKTAEMQVPA